MKGRDGIEHIAIQPTGAKWSSTAGEFFLPYETVRAMADPEKAILEFLDSTYTGAAAQMGCDGDLTSFVTPASAHA